MGNNKSDQELLTELEEELSDAEGWGSSIMAHRNRYLETLYLIDKNLNEDAKILDVGALPYHILYLLDKKGYEVVGIDLEPDRMRDFKEDHGFQVERCDIEKEDLPFEPESFDAVLFLEVFEHLRINPIKTLKNLNEVMKPEGKLFLSTPNLYSYYYISNFVAGKGMDGGYEEFKMLEEAGHMGHVRTYCVREMKQFLENTGFDIEDYNYYNYTAKQSEYRKSDVLSKFIKNFLPFLQTDLFFLARKNTD